MKPQLITLLLLALIIFEFEPVQADAAVGPDMVARATEIPSCAVYVDAASPANGKGSAEQPWQLIAQAIAAAEPGAVICVAEGTYPEQLTPGEKYFTLAGGFQHGASFKVRDSSAYVSKAIGKGGSFLRVEDPGPKNDQLIAIEGFEITGYSQAIYRDIYYSQRFDITNNFVHDNVCADQSLVGGGFALNNVSGTIKGNVFTKNACGRGGAGFLNDSANANSVLIEGNLIDGNTGTEPDSSHGGALYLFGNTLVITGNVFTNNSVTQWGGGLYVGAFTAGNQPTTATLSWNVYRSNHAGNAGGGFFCDDGATCLSSHEVYDKNCGGNILLDGGPMGSGPTTTKFDHITNVRALDVQCTAPGVGVFIDTYEAVAPDSYSCTNALFWGNAENGDFATACSKACSQLHASVTHSMVQTKYADGSVDIAFGKGIVTPADPNFVALEGDDLKLMPASPALGHGNPGGSDLGAYGIGTRLSPSVATGADVKKEAAAPPAAAGATAVAEVDKEISAKQAFDLAKELGTAKAWKAFLESYPIGFLPDLARAYLEKLEGSTPSSTAKAPLPAPDNGSVLALPQVFLHRSVIVRGEKFMGFPEKFNRYYTDQDWKPLATLYVSPDGSGDGTAREKPMAVKDAFAAARPGTLIYFLRGSYEGGLEFTNEASGTYDAPIVLYGEPNDDKSIGVSIACGFGKREACFNFEGASYIAADGFEFTGGKFGIRAVGLDFAASQHARGIAVLNCKGHDQNRDPFFTAQSDWAVFEGNVAHGAKKEDGHGIYLSNGGDWNIVRFNETYENESSDLQVNADPASACQEQGIAFVDPRCDAYAGEGEGGQGASDYFLVDSNYFHHGIGPGANFTSMRRSIVRNNIFGLHATKHNVSFWQETDNPKLGSSENKILHNLFITNGRHGVKFEANSTRNEFVNNVVLGVKIDGGKTLANPSALLMDVDDTVGENTYRSNLYSPGILEGRKVNESEIAVDDFSASWFTSFPTTLNHDPRDFTPRAGAPFLNKGEVSNAASWDRNGAARSGKVDLGPIEIP